MTPFLSKKVQTNNQTKKERSERTKPNNFKPNYFSFGRLLYILPFHLKVNLKKAMLKKYNLFYFFNVALFFWSVVWIMEIYKPTLDICDGKFQSKSSLVKDLLIYLMCKHSFKQYYCYFTSTLLSNIACLNPCHNEAL